MIYLTVRRQRDVTRLIVKVIVVISGVQVLLTMGSMNEIMLSLRSSRHGSTIITDIDVRL